MKKGLLIATLLIISHSVFTKVPASTDGEEYMCSSFIPIDLRDPKYNDIITYIEERVDMELHSYLYDGVIVLAFDTTRPSTEAKGEDDIRRKFGPQFQGKNLKCEIWEKY